LSLSIWQLDPASLTPYYNIAVCDALASAGHDVRYVTSQYLYDPDLRLSANFKTDYAYFRGLNQPWLLKVSPLRKLLRGLMYPFNHHHVLAKMRQSPPDIVHIQWSRLPTFDLHFIQSIKKLGIPIVHTVHNVRSSFASDQMVEKLGYIYALCDKLMVHTHANKTEFLKVYPNISDNKLTVIPHIQFNYPYPIPPVGKSDLKQEFGFVEEDMVLLFFGIIRQYKGLDVLLSAFEEVEQSNQTVHLLIAGKPESDQDIENINRAKTMEGVTIHDWFIPAEDLWKYFHVSDIVIFPYRSVTQSGALIQTMEFGKPVIVTDVGGFRETIDGNGWIVPPESPSELADTIQTALANSEDLAHKGKRSQELIDQLYAPSAIATQLTDMYTTIERPSS